jgi:hypothetical protein
VRKQELNEERNGSRTENIRGQLNKFEKETEKEKKRGEKNKNLTGVNRLV